MTVIRRYRADWHAGDDYVAVNDDVEGRVIAWTESADDASRITGALNDDEGAVSRAETAEREVERLRLIAETQGAEIDRLREVLSARPSTPGGSDVNR